MAILGDKNGIHVEVKYDRYEAGWVYYHFGFFLHQKPFFNPAVMWRKNYIECENYSSEHLIEYLEQSLEGDVGYHWFPEEDDISIRVVPSQYADGFFQVEFNPSSYKFDVPKRQEGIYGDGEVIIKVYADRWGMEQFIADLKSEYKEFLKNNEVAMEKHEGQLEMMSARSF